MATNNAWNSQDPAQVTLGGTGDSSLTAYSVLCGGTTSTAPIQSVASVGSAGQILTSSGASNLPTWGSSGAGSLVKLSTVAASGQANISFNDTLITGTYNIYMVQFNQIVPAVSSGLRMQWSTNNGSTFIPITNNITGWQRFASNTSWTAGSSPQDGNFYVTGSTVTFGGFGYGGVMWLYNMGSAGNPTWVSYGSSAGGPATSVAAIRSYGYNSAGPYTVNYLNFNVFNSATSSTFSSGSITLYGLAQ